MTHYKDNDKQFIFEMFGSFMKDKKLIKKFETPDMYIIYWLDKLIREGKMSANTGKRIFGKMFVTLDEILKELGV